MRNATELARLDLDRVTAVRVSGGPRPLLVVTSEAGELAFELDYKTSIRFSEGGRAQRD